MYNFLWKIPFSKSTQYLTLNASKPWNAKPRKVPLPFFRHCKTFPTPFRLCETFFEIFLKSSMGPPSIFWCFDLNGCWKSMKALFYIFRHYETVKSSHFLFFFEKLKKIEIFQCLRKPSFLKYFATNWIFKKPKESPLYNFKIFALLSLGYGADLRRSRLVFSFFSSDYNPHHDWSTFLTTETTKTTKAESGLRKFSAKGPPFIF